MNLHELNIVLESNDRKVLIKFGIISLLYFKRINYFRIFRYFFALLFDKYIMEYIIYKMCLFIYLKFIIYVWNIYL